MSKQPNALIQAIREKNVHEVERLLKKGADSNATEENIPALIIAINQVADGDEAKCTAIVEFLLDFRADVNKPGQGKLTPLMIAASPGGGPALSKIAEMLLTRGADPEAISDDGKKALHMAEKSAIVYDETCQLIRNAMKK